MENPEDQELLATPRFRVVRRHYQDSAGRPHTRETVQHPGAVVILPLLDDGRICLIRNFRVAVGRTMIELPAGTLEPAETAIETAYRELIEETGYRAGRLEYCLEFYMSPGILNERMQLFVAQALTAGPQALEAGEQIDTLLVDWEEAFRMIGSGEIVDGKTIAALLYYDRFHRGPP